MGSGRASSAPPAGSWAEPQPQKKYDLGRFMCNFINILVHLITAALQGRIYSKPGPVRKKMWGPRAQIK